MRAAAAFCDGDNTMGTEPAFTPDQHDVSYVDLILGYALDHQRVPGPNGWEHAPTRRRETKAAEGAQNLRSKLAPRL
jgi:hypothetical protein